MYILYATEYIMLVIGIDRVEKFAEGFSASTTLGLMYSVSLLATFRAAHSVDLSAYKILCRHM